MLTRTTPTHAIFTKGLILTLIPDDECSSINRSNATLEQTKWLDAAESAEVYEDEELYYVEKSARDAAHRAGMPKNWYVSFCHPIKDR